MSDAYSGISVHDRAVDHTLAALVQANRFLLNVTPIDAEDWRQPFLSGEVDAPEFHYRELDLDPDVAEAQLDLLPLDAVEDASVGALLRNRHREARLQIEMMRVRDTDDFRQLSVELYGGVSPSLRDQAEAILGGLPPKGPGGELLGAAEILELAQAEIEYYRELDADVGMHAEIREDVAGVLCDGPNLLIGTAATVGADRANALIQHEVGTHLVTQVNGAGQPLQLLAAGLAGYEETQEGLAVLAEIGCGQLTGPRMRTLACRVLAVHAMLSGASFRETHALLVERGQRPGAAYVTAMRVFRAGGLAKDAIYLRGLLELVEHLVGGGSLELFFRGKFALRDLPLVQDLTDRGSLAPPRVLPRYLTDPAATERWGRLSLADPLTMIATTVEEPA